MSLLALERVAVDLEGVHVLTDVTFDLDRGSCLGLVGETGSGKSLTCRVITGLIKRIGGRVVQGKALFEGGDLITLDDEDWRRIRGHKIALIPQASMSSLDPRMRIDRQLKETLGVLDPDADPVERTLELLEQVHMPEPRRISRLYPHELSGGMRQRVMIALALAGRPSLLVADEATTALDVTVQRGILGLLDELRRERQMSVLLVSHDLAVVQSVADSVAVMYAGAVVERGPTAKVLSSPEHPYTEALLSARPVGSHGRPGKRMTGSAPGPLDRPAGCAFHPRCPISEDRDRCRKEVPEQQALMEARHFTACHRADELVR